MTKRATAAKAPFPPPEPRQVQTTLVMPEDLWRRVKIRAIDERSDLRDIANRALEAYLQTPLPEDGI